MASKEKGYQEKGNAEYFYCWPSITAIQYLFVIWTSFLEDRSNIFSADVRMHIYIISITMSVHSVLMIAQTNDHMYLKGICEVQFCTHFC